MVWHAMRDFSGDDGTLGHAERLAILLVGWLKKGIHSQEYAAHHLLLASFAQQKDLIVGIASKESSRESRDWSECKVIIDDCLHSTFCGEYPRGNSALRYLARHG